MICIECEEESYVKEIPSMICFNCSRDMCHACYNEIHKGWVESAGFTWHDAYKDVGAYGDFYMSCFKCYTIHKINGTGVIIRR